MFACHYINLLSKWEDEHQQCHHQTRVLHQLKCFHCGVFVETCLVGQVSVQHVVQLLYDQHSQVVSMTMHLGWQIDLEEGRKWPMLCLSGVVSQWMKYRQPVECNTTKRETFLQAVIITTHQFIKWIIHLRPLHSAMHLTAFDLLNGSFSECWNFIAQLVTFHLWLLL